MKNKKIKQFRKFMCKTWADKPEHNDRLNNYFFKNLTND